MAWFSAVAGAVASEMASENSGGILGGAKKTVGSAGSAISNGQAADMASAESGAKKTVSPGLAQNFYQGLATGQPVFQMSPDGQSVDWGSTLARAGGRYAQREALNGFAYEDEKQKMAKMFVK